MKRICLLTTSHVSYAPRLLKEADALDAAGFAVRVVALNVEPVKQRLDAELMAHRAWRLQTVDAQRRGKGRGMWLRAALRQKCFLSYGILRRNERGAALALSRFLPEIETLASAERADLFIAHTIQALPAAVAAADRFGAKAGVDFEDSFTGMRRFDSAPTLQDELVERLEQKYVARCAHRIAASPGVAEAVARRHGILPPQAVMNVFPLSARPAKRDFAKHNGPLGLYWFSQVVGHDRGLADAVQALGLLPSGSAELHLRGRCDESGRTFLRQLMDASGLDERCVTVHSPEAPERMVSLAAEYDVGLALEEPISENRLICMRDLCTNKVFTYLLAGLALAATAERDSGEVYDGAGFAYRHGRPELLAAGLRRWLESPDALVASKKKAWLLGETRYNWDLEKQKLIAAVNAVLN